MRSQQALFTKFRTRKQLLQDYETPIKAAAALGGSAESWLGMQAAYDLWHAAKKRRPKIEKIERAH